MCASFSSHHPLKFSYVVGISSVGYCFTLIYLVCDTYLCLCLCMFVPQCAQKRQRATPVSWHSLYTTWVLDTSQPWWQAPLHSGSCWKFRACVMCVCVWTPVCQGMSGEDRGHLQDADSVRPPCSPWELNSSSQAWWQMSYLSIHLKDKAVGFYRETMLHWTETQQLGTLCTPLRTLRSFSVWRSCWEFCIWPFAHACAFSPLWTNVTQINRWTQSELGTCV